MVIVGMSTTMKTRTSVPLEEEEEQNIMKEPEISGLFTILVIFILVISILHFLCTIFFIINKLFKTNVRCKRGKTQVHKPIVRKNKLLRRTRRPLRSQFEMFNIYTNLGSTIHYTYTSYNKYGFRGVAVQ